MHLGSANVLASRQPRVVLFTGELYNASKGFQNSK